MENWNWPTLTDLPSQSRSLLSLGWLLDSAPCPRDPKHGHRHRPLITRLTDLSGLMSWERLSWHVHQGAVQATVQSVHVGNMGVQHSSGASRGRQCLLCPKYCLLCPIVKITRTNSRERGGGGCREKIIIIGKLSQRRKNLRKYRKYDLIKVS